uniref:Uncharacterized protein n=1 Tax=Anguilla anguilla TaxID=7936 RepID=A0A0E9T7Q6_ANGAN
MSRAQLKVKLAFPTF